MPDTFDHVAYLAEEIGPRPAGSEQEQQAALYIADTIQQESGLHAEIEDFHPRSDGTLVQVVCGIVALITVILALVLPVMAVPAIIITVLLAVITVLEQTDRPFISNMLSGKDSQNIVARYVPDTATAKTRKIVVVAHYDSGKNRRELSPTFLPLMPVFSKATLIAAILLPVFLIIRGLFFLNATGAAAIILDIFIVLIALVSVIPCVFALLARLAPYNDGANCDATGVAILMDTAIRAGEGSRPYRAPQEYDRYAEPSDDPIIHGEEAAFEAGVVPEGAELSYEYEGETAEPASHDAEEGPAIGVMPAARAAAADFQETADDADPAERLLAAKRAIAALTGRPTSMTISCDIEHLRALDEERKASEAASVQVSEEPEPAAVSADADQAPVEEQPEAAAEAVVAAEAPTAEAEPEPVAEEPVAQVEEIDDDPNLPAWFKRARANARRNPEEDNAPVQRSRFADALKVAEVVSSSRFAAVAEPAEPEQTELGKQIEGMRDAISQAPEFHYDRALLEEVDRVQAERETEQEEPGFESEHVAVEPEADDPSMKLEPIEATAEQEEQAERTAAEEGDSLFDMIEEDTGDEGDLDKTVAMPALGLQTGAPVLQSIPRVVLPEVSAELPQVEDEPEDGSRPSLRSVLPSITGSISYVGAQGFAGQAAPVKESSLEPAEEPVGVPALDASTFPSFGATSGSAEATDSFAVTGEQILNEEQEEAPYAVDADDPAFEEDFADQDAFAGRDYAEAPKKEGFFSKLFKRNKGRDEFDVSASEWLDVDDDYTARSVGEQRGSWESFKPADAEDIPAQEAPQASAPAEQEAAGAEFKTLENNRWNANDWNRDGWGRGWNGGAFSGLKQKLGSLRHSKEDELVPAEDIYDEDAPAAYEDEYVDEYQTPEDYGHEMPKPEPEVEIESVEEQERPRSRKRSRARRSIESFRRLDLNTEVWFVALGSQCAGNAGMKAFLAAHERDLHGALIIELDGLGAGELSYVKKEGMSQPVEVSRRALRFLKKAQNSTGLHLKSVDLPWGESASSLAMRQGMSALHLIGEAQGKPAFCGEAADTIDNIDFDVLAENADFVTELLNTI